MITARVTQYQFCNCWLQLLGDKLFRVHIESQNPDWAWEMTTPIPKSCPIEAFMVAELEVLKSLLKADSCPACLIMARKNSELVVASNRATKELLGNNVGEETRQYVATGYDDWLQEVKAQKKIFRLLHLIGKNGIFLKLNVEAQLLKSPVSVVNWLYCRAVS